jgi:hypothetical protein
MKSSILFTFFINNIHTAINNGNFILSNKAVLSGLLNFLSSLFCNHNTAININKAVKD